MIAWSNLYLVAAVSVFSTIALVAICALGIRFLTDASRWRIGALKRKQKAQRKVILYSAAAYVCFAICFAALLFGVYLVVPYFHG